MRPSCPRPPPPSTPSTARAGQDRGDRARSADVGPVGALAHGSKRCSVGSGSASAASPAPRGTRRAGRPGGVRERQHGGRQQAALRRPPGRSRASRPARRAASARSTAGCRARQRAALHRHAEHRQAGVGRQHAGQVRGAAGAGDDRSEPRGRRRRAATSASRSGVRWALTIAQPWSTPSSVRTSSAWRIVDQSDSAAHQHQHRWPVAARDSSWAADASDVRAPAALGRRLPSRLDCLGFAHVVSSSILAATARARRSAIAAQAAPAGTASSHSSRAPTASSSRIAR
jgi:hypothetical protein